MAPRSRQDRWHRGEGCRALAALDTSPVSGSQPTLGAVMQTRRHEVCLATKSNKRQRGDVLAALHHT